LKGHIVRPGYVVGDSKTAGSYSYYNSHSHIVWTDIPALQLPTPTTSSGVWSKAASSSGWYPT
jgi:thioester reductase-like protein